MIVHGVISQLCPEKPSLHAHKYEEPDIDTVKHFNSSCKKVAILCNHKTNNSISTSTSKQNYIDPRIIFSYSKRENISTEKLLSNSLINKYSWANSIDSNFIF